MKESKTSKTHFCLPLLKWHYFHSFDDQTFTFITKYIFTKKIEYTFPPYIDNKLHALKIIKVCPVVFYIELIIDLPVKRDYFEIYSIIPIDHITLTVFLIQNYFVTPEGLMF